MIKKFFMGGLGILGILILTLIILLPHLAGKTDSKSLSNDAQVLIDSAFSDLPLGWIDYHTHLLGVNTDDAYVNPKMKAWHNPFQFYRYKVYLRASGITQENLANQQYLDRLKSLLQDFPIKGKSYLLAFDKFYKKNGGVNWNETEFYVSNDYVYQVSQDNPDFFVPVISVNPYRKDSLETLNLWHKKGVRLIKWLPNAMGFDPMDPQLIPFYQRVKELNMVILTHVGIEIAVESTEHQAYGNPLRWRDALALGTKVIFAHVGSLGECEDFETTGKPRVDCFDLSIRMLSDEQYQENLFADISATILINRKEKVLRTLLTRKDLHHRLVNGSDYPIPAINAMISTRLLEHRGFLTNREAALLREIYHYNPLIFDFVLKRILHLPDSEKTFPASMFQLNNNI